MVVKNMKNMKSVQSKLGVALAKGANSGVLGNFVGDATAGIFSGSEGLGGMFGPNRKVKLKKAIDDNATYAATAHPRRSSQGASQA